MTARKIITEYIHPPIPARQFDWMAWYDGDDEEGLRQYGATEAEARQNLIRAALDNLPKERVAAVAQEQIRALKADRARWVELQDKDAHKNDAPVQIAAIDAEIRRFEELGNG